MDRKSQASEILKHLQSGRPLTPLEALERFGCFRLSGRILELRQAGHKISTEIVEYKGKRFAEYSLEKSQ